MKPSTLRIPSDPRIAEVPLPSFIVPFTSSGCVPHLTPDLFSKTLGPTDFAGFECGIEPFLEENGALLSGGGGDISDSGVGVGAGDCGIDNSNKSDGKSAVKLKACFSLNPHPIFLATKDDEYCGYNMAGKRPCLSSSSHTLNKIDRGIAITNKEGISYFKQRQHLPSAIKSLNANFWISPLDSYPQAMAERRKRVLRASKMTLELLQEGKEILENTECTIIPSVHISSSFEDITKGDLDGVEDQNIIAIVGDSSKIIPSDVIGKKGRITIYRGKALSPEEMICNIRRGFDLFSCASILKDAEDGKAILIDANFCVKRLDLYGVENFAIMNTLDEDCGCIACKNGKSSISYMHHLLKTKEMLAKILLTSHNLYQLSQMFKRIRRGGDDSVLSQ